MKFRNGLSYKVEPLKTYELDLPKEDVIYRLREQDGYCRNKSTGDQPLEFICSKKGNVKVRDLSRHKDQQVFLQGEMVTENGKTKLNVFTVKRRGLIVESIIVAVLSLIVDGMYLWIMLRYFRDVHPAFWVIFALSVVTIPMSLAKLFKKRDAIPIDTEIMLKEIDQRILGVTRWDD